MTLHYADTSALVRCYFPDEPDHELLRELIFENEPTVVTSELTRVEFASAISAASRGGRLDEPKSTLDRFDVDCNDDGPVTLLALELSVVLPYARSLVLDHALSTLDALHVSVVLTTVRDLVDHDEDIVVVTRDACQLEAAQTLGFTVV